jgi:hypothetical protein
MAYCNTWKLNLVLELAFIIFLTSIFVFVSISHFNININNQYYSLFALSPIAVITSIMLYYLKKNVTVYIKEKKTFVEQGEGVFTDEFLLITNSINIRTCECLYNIIRKETTVTLKCFGIPGLRLYATDLVN